MKKDKLDFIEFAANQIKKDKSKSFNSIEKEFRASGGSVRRQNGQTIVREIKDRFNKSTSKRTTSKKVAFEVFSKLNTKDSIETKIDKFNSSTSYKPIAKRTARKINTDMSQYPVYRKPPKNYLSDYNYIISYMYKKDGELGMDYITIPSKDKELTKEEIFQKAELYFNIIEGQGRYSYEVLRETAKIEVAYKGKYKRGYTKKKGKSVKDKKK